MTDRSRAKTAAAAQWADLRDNLQTITPRMLARAGLVVAVLASIVQLTIATWPALLPFIAGGVLAYVLLPVVDSLDRVMPRPLAALLAVLGTLLVIVGVLIVVLPPLVITFVRLAGDFPDAAAIDLAVARLQQRIGSLPEGSTRLLVPALTAIAITVKDALSGASGSFDNLGRLVVAGLLNAVGALLGLIVLPTWMLTLMAGKHQARAAIDRRLAPWIRRDFWAVATIVDRATGAYLRGYIVIGVLVGALVYLGLAGAGRFGGQTFTQPVALAVFAGASQLIPAVGALVGLLPALLILTVDPTRAGVYVGVYIAARLLGSSVLGSRLSQRRIRVHPGILVPAIVMVSQFGLAWLLLSAPLIAIANDLVRYIHGRLSEPPSPAGVLPGTAAARAGAVRSARVPSAYQPATAPAPLVTREAAPSAAAALQQTS